MIHVARKPIDTVYRTEPGRQRNQVINTRNNITPNYELKPEENFILKKPHLAYYTSTFNRLITLIF
jgi:hypothetical protein